MSAEAGIAIPQVMVIDDEKFDQMLYERILKRSALVGQITSFLYADEALQYLLRRDRPQVDVIFLDINMPRMNGFEFLDAATQKIGPDFASLCIVMLTTSISPEDRVRALEFAPVRGFMNKPLTLEKVAEAAAMLEAVRAKR
jgi:CheY-like chemotaxis protein